MIWGYFSDFQKKKNTISRTSFLTKFTLDLSFAKKNEPNRKIWCLSCLKQNIQFLVVFSAEIKNAPIFFVLGLQNFV